MIHTIPVSKDNYYKAVLMIMSPYLGGLTDYETNLLAEMLNTNTKHLDTENRRTLQKRLDTDVYTFNNYVKRLKDKGVLVQSNNTLEINPNLTSQINDKQITIKFNVT